jgi:hypothetical protein
MYLWQEGARNSEESSITGYRVHLTACFVAISGLIRARTLEEKKKEKGEKEEE